MVLDTFALTKVSRLSEKELPKLEGLMTVKEEALRLISSLPNNVTWEDLIYAVQLVREIELGIVDAEAGRFLTTAEVMRDFDI